MRKLAVATAAIACLLAGNAQAANPFYPYVLATVTPDEATGSSTYWWKLINNWPDSLGNATPQQQSDYRLSSFAISVAAGAEISNIVSPTGWTYALNDGDISGGLPGRERTLTWTATAPTYYLKQEVTICNSHDPYCHYPPGAVFGLVSNFTAANSKYLLAAANGESLNGSFPIAMPVVPEPSTYALMFIALPIVGYAVRQRRSSV